MSAALQKRLDQNAERLRDILRQHPEVCAEVERAYRRGFHQAAHAAAEAARDRYTREDFDHWADCVRRWRYAQSEDATCPPEPWEVR